MKTRWISLKNHAVQAVKIALLISLLVNPSLCVSLAVEAQSPSAGSGLMNIQTLSKNPFQLPPKSLHIPRQVFARKLSESVKPAGSTTLAGPAKSPTPKRPALVPALAEKPHEKPAVMQPDKLSEKPSPKLADKLSEKSASESPSPQKLLSISPAELKAETLPPPASEEADPSVTTVPIPLAAGDVIDVQDSVMGVLVKNGNILSDGSISLPLVGRIALAGKTVAEARQDLTGRYKQFYTEPQISLRIARRHPVRVYLTGAVANPGVYISGKDTRPEALKNQAALGDFNHQFRFYRLYLADALIMAGGLNYNANVRDILIHRRYPTQQVLHVNVLELFQGGSTVQDIALQDQDVVEVSALSENALVMDAPIQEFERSNLNSDEFKISVIGAVTKPGGYTLHRSDNVLSAIAKAGGFTPVANTGRVFVLHATERGQLTHREINLQDKKLIGKRPIAEWTALLPNDVIFVDESGARKSVFYGRDLFLDRIAVAAMFPFFSKFFSGR